MAPGKQPNCDVLGNLRLRCLLYWLRKEQGRGGASVAGDSPKDSVARGNLPCLSCSPSEKMQAQEAVTLFYRGEVCGPKSTACYVGALPLDYFYQPLCFNVEKLGLFLPRPASAHTNNSGGNKRSCLLSSLPAQPHDLRNCTNQPCHSHLKDGNTEAYRVMCPQLPRQEI